MMKIPKGNVKNKKSFRYNLSLENSNSFYKGFFFAFLFLGVLGVLTAVGFHTADEILSGTFRGDYFFEGSVDFTNASVLGAGTLKFNSTTTVNCSSSLDGVFALNETSREVLFCNGYKWEFFKRVGPYFNNFGDGSDGDISVRSDGIYQDLGGGYVQIHGSPQWPSTEDGDIVVINAQNFEVQSGVTFTTTNRCRGLIVYAIGDVDIDGTISMTARGAAVNPATSGLSSDGNAVPVEGLVIRRLKSDWSDIDAGIISSAGASSVADFQGSHSSSDLFYGAGNAAVNSEAMQGEVENGLVIKIPRVGGVGGSGGNVPNHSAAKGSKGGAIMFALAGGGGGGATAGNPNPVIAGDGGDATCFSGGTGGGGSGVRDTHAGKNAGDGNNFGGVGGNGYAFHSGSYSTGGSGVGNPSGTPVRTGTSPSGTGGLLIVVAKNDLIISGSVESRGTNSADTMAASYSAAGGASGGGAVVLLYGNSLSNSGSVNVNGGTGGSSYLGSGPGGDGGDGSIIGPIQIDNE